MKYSLIYFAFMLLLELSCNKNVATMNNTMVLRIAASYSGMVGYGYVYQCEVVEVIKGEFEDSILTLTILHNDTDNLNFVSSHLSPEEIIVEFKKDRINEPYSKMPISGTVDNSKTSWIIKKIELPK